MILVVLQVLIVSLKLIFSCHMCCIYSSIPFIAIFSTKIEIDLNYCKVESFYLVVFPKSDKNMNSNLLIYSCKIEKNRLQN